MDEDLEIDDPIENDDGPDIDGEIVIDDDTSEDDEYEEEPSSDIDGDIRPPDEQEGFIVDDLDDGGSAPEPYDEDPVPPEELIPVGNPETKTITVRISEIIHDFSTESLLAYEESGAIPYAVYDDGTKVQVQWSDVTVPEIGAGAVVLEAELLAKATNQHFWSRATDPDHDGAGTGAFVTDDEQDDFLAAAAQGFPDWGDGTQGTKPWHNLLMNSLGILLRTALNNLVSITRSAIAFFDGTGNQAANVVASFGSGGVQIGKTGESRMELDYRSLKMMDKEGNKYLHISDLRDADGTFELTENFAANYADYVIALVPSEVISVMVDDVSVGYTLTTYEDLGYARIRLDNPAYPQSGSIVSVRYKTTSGNAKAYTLGTRKANANIGAMSYAEGKNVESSGYISHAEGMNTVASHRCSHAEGDGTKATSLYCHAEGSETIASDWASHAEGMNTVASGVASHAGGSFTVAAGLDQTAIGRYNVEDSNGTYALIIGNGTDDSDRSNALTVDWDGDVLMGSELTLHADNVKIDTSANNGVSSNTAIGFMSLSDMDDYWAGRVGAYVHSNGSTVSYLGARNKKTDGTDVTNYIQAGVTKAGKPYYWMTSPTAFRTALGFGDSTWETQDDTGPAVSVANSSWAKLTQVTLSAGHWLVLVAGYAASNSTGRRGFHLSSASSVTAARFLSALMAPPSGAALYTVIPYLVNPTASTTYNIFGYQNSGGNLNMSALVRAIHLYTA